MAYMQLGSAIKASSRPPFVPTTTIAYGYGEVSRNHMRKTIRLENSAIRYDHKCSRKFECRHENNKDVTEFYPHKRKKTKFLPRVARESSNNGLDSTILGSQINSKSIGAMFDVIYKYSKVYALKGVALSIISVSLLAIQRLSDFTPSFFLGLLQAIVGGCLANLYVAGINQLSDIDIDKVNKPYLPLASGELSIKTAIILTTLYAILGFGLGWTINSWSLKLGLFLWYAFGTTYSVHLPLLRWKRNPVLAAICVWAVKGAIIPILFHFHAQTYIHGSSVLLSKHAIFVSGFMSVFGIVAALFKLYSLEYLLVPFLRF